VNNTSEHVAFCLQQQRSNANSRTRHEAVLICIYFVSEAGIFPTGVSAATESFSDADVLTVFHSNYVGGLAF